MNAEDHTTSRQIHLVSRPEGWPTEDTFRLEEVELPELGEGEVRVANEFVSVDPYMRGRMVEQESYVEPYRLGEAMDGGAVGRVTASRDASLPEGTLVQHMQGWRDVAQGPAATFTAVPEIEDASSSVHLHLLGMTGLTAYAGLVEVGRLREGESVFVSGAAGSVGTAAGQFARLLGASRVVGSAGSDEKVAVLTEKYGYDAAVNYKDAPIREQLPDVIPDGIDVYYDNVGGDHLEAAIDVMNRGGRGVLCGAISSYNERTARPGPDNLGRLITFSLSLRGFTVREFAERYRDEFADRAGTWLREGRLVYDETVVDGVENAPQAFIDMMKGANIGKMLVRT